MDAKHFLKEFWHIASAPNGVQRLREMVLRLAVSGKLTTQEATEDCTQLYDLMNENRNDLLERKVFSPLKKIRKVENRVPWEIPSNWQWERLGNLCYFSTGRTPARKEARYWSNGKYNWFSIADLKHGEIINRSKEKISELAVKECFNGKPSPPGTLLMSFKLTIGKMSVLEDYAYHNEAIISIFPFADCLREYFFKCLSGFDLFFGAKNAIKGSTLNRDSISNILVALPPKQEIKRIVAKVDELMALCDKLEAQQKEREKLEILSCKTVFDSVGSGVFNNQLSNSWERAAGNWNLCSNQVYSILQIREVILNLAIKGKLVPQKQDDQPASILVEEVKKKRDSLIAEKKIKKIKRKKIREENTPYEIPTSWEWVRFSDIGELARGKSKHRPRNDPKLYHAGVYPLIQTGDVARSTGLITNYSKMYNETGLAQSRLWPKGTLCITIAANIADSALLGIEACFPDSIVGFIPFQPITSARYFEFFMRTAKNDLSKFAPGMAQKNINLSILDNVYVPLPPLEEQERIVKKVNQLMALCDQLEEQLTTKSELAEKLATACVEAITGTRIQEHELMKTPKTELVSKLVSGKTPSSKDRAPLSSLLTRKGGEMSAKDLWNQSGLEEIDEFYKQVKIERANGWIKTEKAYVQRVEEAE